MFRNLFILIIIIAAIWIIRSLLNSSRISRKQPALSKDMVQCEQCKTYIPEDDVIVMDNKNFCSQQHMQDWSNRNK
ncbi:MAG: PP0621 family protein [Gammaproteobacteria bacterium]|nr:PP0621 family protein [Gammaproteobacteria bacterium]MCW8909092.1 PP0621 family protein [Gammaproteobacteria bacterium]MCW9003624.1 PP0621 family protein [Gammaproteobacteria bacterium]MCW9056014.1 PP0621 family protein [Gammaproteobacteria bacterium]